ncbi:MAG TPA: hypothetical protein VN442_08575 [Bryobacteraceae bacterium]|nr:hypothetical protein [Bryobacteraceae bacterium]
MSRTQSEIDQLIACPKTVSEPPRKALKADGAHLRNDMKLTSTLDGSEFHVFMRISADFPENFSIGLRFLPHDGSGVITLLRFNGPHGEFNDHFDPHHPHSEFHVHKATETAMAAGLKAEKWAERSQEFASFAEALAAFLRTAAVVDADLYFGDYLQPRLPFQEEAVP